MKLQSPTASFGGFLVTTALSLVLAQAAFAKAWGRGFSLDNLRAVFASAEGFRKDELMRNLDARLIEIDKLMSTLRSQRRELRDLQETLRRSWAAGDCVDAMTLANGVSRKAMREGGRRVLPKPSP